MGRPVVTKATVPLRGDLFMAALTQMNQAQSAVTPVSVHDMSERALVSGDYSQEWEIEAVYSAGQPVVLRLYEKGVAVAEAPVTNCGPDSN